MKEKKQQNYNKKADKINERGVTQMPKKKKNDKLDVDPRRDDDASPMSSYRCMLRPTSMFMDRMIAPINVHSKS